MVLVLSFSNVVYHIDLFVDVEPALQPRNKSHLIIENDSFNVLLDSISKDLVEDFGIHSRQRNRYGILNHSLS